jgi:hypothetical protein
MSKSSVITQLTDEDQEMVNHMIRRDAATDLEIAKEIERKLGRQIANTDAARSMVVVHWRRGEKYRAWLDRYLNRTAQMERELALQRERFEMVSRLVQPGTEDGMSSVSEALVARLLTLAAEADDKTLKDAVAGRGWLSQALSLAQQMSADSTRQKVEKLKAQIAEMMSPRKKTVSAADVVSKVDELMGLAKT